MTRSRFPHPLVLLVSCVLLAGVATYVLPAGQFERVFDVATGRDVVVAGTYQPVAPDPVGPFAAFTALTAGFLDAGDVIALVFLIGGAFTVLDKAGTLQRLIAWLLYRLRHGELAVIVVLGILFATAGALENMQEEIVPMMPVLLLLTARLGLRPVTAVSMSAGAAVVGSAFSPINPFQVGIAQRVAQLPLLSGWAFRTVFLVIAVGFWLAMTVRYAARTRVTAPDGGDPHEAAPLGPRHAFIVALVVATFVMLTYGLLALGWEFPEMSALFFIMGIVVGLIGGLGLDGTARAYAEGFAAMALPALLIGVARTIYVVLEQGRVVDTLVHALFTPLSGLPPTASALGMMAAHVGIHVPVSSVSGQAVLTMPLLVPLADLLDISRQVVVLAYQYGAGLCDMLTPTNGSIMAILVAAGVGWDEWFAVVWRWAATLLALGAVAVYIAVAIGLQ
ncbi:MAG: YfcC family protein [Acidobacteriota bacterium]|jgi:uncharacterized ion transporter superfamily protein YfcC